MELVNNFSNFDEWIIIWIEHMTARHDEFIYSLKGEVRILNVFMVKL